MWEQRWIRSQHGLAALDFPAGRAQGCGETFELSSTLSQAVSGGRRGRFLSGEPLSLAWVQSPALHLALVVLWEAEESPQTVDVACGLPGRVCSAETCVCPTLVTVAVTTPTQGTC